MDQQVILNKLKHLENKIQKLTEDYQALQEENNRLKQENTELREQLEEKKEEVKNFYNQAKISKIVTAVGEDTQNNNELKLIIDEYIREIDKCIAYLNQ